MILGSTVSVLDTLSGMQDAFAYVLFAVVGIGIVGAIVSFFFTSDAWSQIGSGGLFEDDGKGSGAPEPSSAAGLAERDDDIRQMLEARNARREARGHDTVDVETELARLTAPVFDDSLRQEVREMVVARNNRRVAKGREPLDVEAEVARRVQELGG